jgi:hypothetical protein
MGTDLFEHGLREEGPPRLAALFFEMALRHLA